MATDKQSAEKEITVEEKAFYAVSTSDDDD